MERPKNVIKSNEIFFAESSNLSVLSGSGVTMHLAAVPHRPSAKFLHPCMQLFQDQSTSFSASGPFVQHLPESCWRATKAAAKLRVLFVQMLLATPTCCEVVMTACSIASFLPVKTFWSLDSLCCSTSHVQMAMFSSFMLRDSGRLWAVWSNSTF